MGVAEVYTEWLKDGAACGDGLARIYPESGFAGGTVIGEAGRDGVRRVSRMTPIVAMYLFRRSFASWIWATEAQRISTAGTAQPIKTESGGRGEHVRVGIDKQEEDHAERHQVHVDAEDHAGVIKVPTAAHTTDSVHSAEHGEQGRQQQQEGGAIVGEVGEPDGDKHAEDNHDVPAGKGTVSWVQNQREA